MLRGTLGLFEACLGHFAEQRRGTTLLPRGRYDPLNRVNSLTYSLTHLLTYLPTYLVAFN